MVEMAGVEPASKSISGRLSPSAFVYLILPICTSHNRLTYGYPVRSLTLPGDHAKGFCINDARSLACRGTKADSAG